MKVLVSVASRHGSTAEIANVIAAVLRTNDIEADVVSPEAVASLDGFDAVVLGSGVYAGHWLEPAKAFVGRYRIELTERPVFLFSSGPIGDPPKPTQDPVDVAELDASTDAVDHQVFAGRVTRSQLNVFERLITKVVHAEGDFRPWDEVADWANEIARYLKGDQDERLARADAPVGPIGRSGTNVPAGSTGRPLSRSGGS
jgi:menaquinone-dependent protoporphyrinogen oxidase